ncbi:MAG: hypothetical protein JRD43_09165 [Deltaproteobacteria bacterium]|nr:hypothetical protein [Deltaproteobacteria bacterium]MBW2595047.1 hypothetical protein [Deltaproteobacteria bacterium]
MKDNTTKVREALSAAYLKKDTIHAGELWETRVMGHIRSLDVPASPANFSALFGRFVWRFAPVAFLLIVALTVGLVNLDYAPEYEITATFMADPIESTVQQLWGG